MSLSSHSCKMEVQQDQALVQNLTVTTKDTGAGLPIPSGAPDISPQCLQEDHLYFNSKLLCF